MAPDLVHTDILDNLKTAILLVDPDFTVSYINSAAEAMLETSGTRAIGEPISHLFSEQAENQPTLMDSVHAFSAFTKRETQLKLPSGQMITVDCVVTPVEDYSDRSSLIMELQPLDRLLRISREEGILNSQQNSRALIRGLAHEIKNPLGGLRGAAQLLAKELPSEALSDYTNIIIEEADRLSNLVNRMLGSHDLLDLQSLNIHEVLERVRTLVKAETAGSIDLIRDYDPSIPEITGDKERLIQAVLNIVRNAMQAQLSNSSASNNPATDTAPVITLRSRALRQFTIGNLRHRLVCRVEISDNGPGIPEHMLQTIFLPMVSGRADGTGLGLSISQSIINHHNGLIECDSQPGCTTFALYIPLEDSLVEQQP